MMLPKKLDSGVKNSKALEHEQTLFFSLKIYNQLSTQLLGYMDSWTEKHLPVNKFKFKTRSSNTLGLPARKYAV